MAAEKTISAHVGALLRRVRVRLGWGQLKVADRTGATMGRISRWEHGHQAPTLFNLWRLCAAYGLTPAELLREDEPLLPPGWPPEALDALRERPELREAVAKILKGGGEGGEP